MTITNGSPWGHSFFAQNDKEQIVTSLDHQNGKVAAGIDNASRP
jgi:hypothetical protein